MSLKEKASFTIHHSYAYSIKGAPGPEYVKLGRREEGKKKGRREEGKKGRREEGKKGRREEGKKGRREEGKREEGKKSGEERESCK
jgi:hypothetical protein